MGSREVSIHLRADISQYSRQLALASAETKAFGRSTDGLRTPLGNVEKNSNTAGREIDKLSGRLRLATDAALILGPALVPLGAAAVGGVIALSAELGALAGGLGVTILATKGLGDGLKALDQYQLEPTAENLAKLNEEMEKLGPSGENFVRFIDSLEPDLKSLQMAARDGLLPGAQEGIESLLQRLPELRSLISDMASTMGDLASDAGKALGGKRFDAFFEYLRTDGIQILDDTSRTLGFLAEAVANTFAAFGGLSTDFSGGLLKFSEGLAEASANLDSSAGFQEFVAYIQTEGPHALETLGSLGNALLQIVEATAPLGGPVLTIVGQFANAIAKIADSDIGTPLFAGLAALALLNRSMAITASLTAATFGGPAVASMKAYVVGLGTVVTAQERAQMSAMELDAANAKTSGGFGKYALPIAGLTASLTGVSDAAGLSNTAMLSMLGPWGTAAGLALDLKAAYDGLGDSLTDLDAAISGGSADVLTEKIAKYKEQLADLQSTSGNEAAAKGVLNSVGLGIFADPQDEIGALTGKTGDLEAKIAEAEQALRALGGAAGSTVSPFQAMQEATDAAAESEERQTQAILDAVDAMREKRSEALRAANAELNYQAAIDDANAALKENGKDFRKTTEEGRANRQAVYGLADAWNNQSDAAKNAKGSLKEARQNFIDTAIQMGATAGQAKTLANRLFEIPPKRRTEVGLDGVDNAINKAEGLKAILDKLHSKDINIALHYQTIGNKPHAPTPGESADGGTIPKGGAYQDRYHYLLAPGEEVISNRRGQADRHRSLLKSINAGRMADGGTAGGGRRSTFMVSESGSDIVAGAHGIAQALKMLQAALAKSEKSLDKERQSRDDLQSQFDSIASQVGGAYSSLDPFAAATQTGSVWSAGGGMQNPLSIFDTAVAGNTASTQAAQQALAFAQSHGLDGPLYAALAASGNLPLLQQFAALSASEIDTREQAFAAQSNAQSALGGMAANAEVGTQLAAANGRLDKVVDEVKLLRRDVRQADINNQAAQDKNAQNVTAGVNGAAAHGHRRGH